MKINGNGRAEPLTKEEFGKVLRELTGKYRAIFALCWYTAERPGAILQLTVSDVYEDPASRKARRTLVIPARKRKDKRTREVPCSKHLASELRLYDAPAEGWLFPTNSHSGHLTYGTYYWLLMKTFERLGMIGYSPYSTRRGALTHLLREGQSTRRIQEISGHVSLASLQPYLESSEEERRKTAELL